MDHQQAQALMWVPWQDRASTTLSDLYDADLRATRSPVHDLAQRVTIPHPLPGVTYADGVATTADMRSAGPDSVRDERGGLGR